VTRTTTPALPLIALGAWLAACGPGVELSLDRAGPVAIPLTAFCDAEVQGVGVVDVENDYLPRVVTCENGGAPLEALKAQAVAARTYLYYKLSLYGSIRDGQSDQVYSCGTEPGARQRRAVEETAGQFLRYGGGVLCAFYVAGAHQTPPACQGNTSDSTNTERYVTYNWGLSGDDITQSTLGWVNSGNTANRGCMGQWGSRCLADDGWGYEDILKFYYGMDIRLATATGACVEPPPPPPPVNQPPVGHLDSAGCEQITGWTQDPDTPDTPIAVHVYIDGPADDTSAWGFSLEADRHRDDLCDALGSCAHGFALRTPRLLKDGAEHPVYAYGIDDAGEQNSVLTSAPRTLRCDPPTPPLTATTGLLRWIVDARSFDDWSFSRLDDVARLDDAVLEGYAQGPDLPARPSLVRSDDGASELWMLDTGVRRLVPDPGAWRLDDTAIDEIAAAELAALPEGAVWTAAPFLLQGSSAAVFVLDHADCMGAPDPDPDPDAGDSSEDGGEGEAQLETAAAPPGEPPPSEQLEVGEGLACSSSSPRRGGWLVMLALLLRRSRARGQG